ncbi:uncharacterized protein DNG_01412 [Cephalotrichum gorgonifer]|uniref:Pheromone a factor receptor n=1 Tax=Cephalotrichum gorgonifer TaxID=2041049 RepID=A0AAE8MRK7_9PEZI|nr:uncharacterized protein DNG_01412 [Cephalotrichum gorgonifer]
MGATIINGSAENMSDLWLAHHDIPSQSSLTANMICRVVFGSLSNLFMWVPLSLLYRNGELAAVVLIAATMVYNAGTVVNAIVWQTDNVSSWWMGFGYCDVFVYLNYPILTIYTSSVLAIMRNLAAQISLMRADSLNLHEKRRRNLVQALIIFPVPILQVAWIYPLSVHRYYVLTLVGCTWWPSRTWPSVVFFCLPQPAFALAAAWYAGVTFWRFRQLSRSTLSALSTSNGRATSRARRAKRRLYFMTLAILVPYLPITLMYFINNIRYIVPLDPYDFGAVRRGEVDGLPWDSVILLPSRALDFATQNDRFTAILTVIPVFGFFGMSKDAINIYRRYLVALGLARIWPSLEGEYDPDRTGSRFGSSHGTSGIIASSTTTQYAHSLLSMSPFPLPSLTTTTAYARALTEIPLAYRSYTKHSISVTLTSQPSTSPAPPPTVAPKSSRFFRFLRFFPFRSQRTHGRILSTSSTSRIIGSEEHEMLEPERMSPRMATAQIHGQDARAAVETRVWSRDEEVGEGSTPPGRRS